MTLRRDISFRAPVVDQALPEFFLGEYPRLVEFLNAYEDVLDSAGGVDEDIRSVMSSRDVDTVSLDFVDLLLKETALGASADLFSYPREAARYMPLFWKRKGSAVSAKTFFRLFFGEEPDISYPKDDIFVVGESEVGPDSLKVIQDGALYQVLSVLIRTSLSVSTWQDLYKKFVHPAGFYLGGSVLIENVTSPGIAAIDADLNAPADAIVITDEAILGAAPAEDALTGLIDDMFTYRVDLERHLDQFDALTLALYDSQYDTVLSLVTPNTPGFSNDSGIVFSNTLEDFSRSPFDSTFYPGESAYVVYDLSFVLDSDSSYVVDSV